MAKQDVLLLVLLLLRLLGLLGLALLLESLLGLDLAQELVLLLGGDLLAVGRQDALLEHARGKDLEHAPAFLDALLLRQGLVVLVRDVFVIVAAGWKRAWCVSQPRQSSGDRERDEPDALVVVVAAVVSGVALVVKRLGGLAVAPDALVGELLHHLEELLPVVLQQLVGDREDSFCKDAQHEKRASAQVTRLEEREDERGRLTLDGEAAAEPEEVAFAVGTAATRLACRRGLVLGCERVLVVVLHA